MQSNLSAGSTLYQCPLPWRRRGINFTAQKAIFTTPKFPSRKTLTLTKSLRTSINYDNEEEVNNRPGPANPVRLPVVIRKSGRVSRYLWNGYCLELIRTDGGASSFCFEFDNGFQKLFRVSSLAVRDFFIPKRVDENYMGYVQWKFLHRVFSSALQVLATQAMFRAIGIGYSRSLPSAAALNWVLKDGLGRLSRCIYTASLSSAFDTNLKRVRFTTSVVFSLSIGVELLTPVFPDYFLLLASIANIAKQISLACYLATASAVHRSFAIVDNLGEVSAKAQIQSVCFDNIGLMLAAILNMFVKNHQRLQAGLPFVIYPFFSAIDLFGIYQGLKHVHLQTLTKDRLEIILDTWIKFRCVPSPAEVSKEEGINFLGKKGKKSWHIRIGCLDPKGEMSNLSMMAMKSLSSDDYYFICMEIYRGLRRIPQRGILISLREGAGTADIIMGLLQACYVRAALCLRSRWENMITTNAMSDLILEEWFSLMEESKVLAESDYFLLDKQMSEQGWAVKNILLNSQEQARYSFVDD